ncbi:unnamed protein product [Soboliphyme baturini]|uniref:AF4/FMR2 family member lilli n=1 Tax=Soboliphyme baturini TaxID=241478 RepID=A0A183IM76_9BILA|nr:unnamed protein product [Soboliphyme baturini]
MPNVPLAGVVAKNVVPPDPVRVEVVCGDERCNNYAAKLPFTGAEAGDSSTIPTTIVRPLATSVKSSSSFSQQQVQVPPKRSVAQVHPIQSAPSKKASVPTMLQESPRPQPVGVCSLHDPRHYSSDVRDKLSSGMRPFKPPVPKKPGSVSLHQDLSSPLAPSYHWETTTKQCHTTTAKTTAIECGDPAAGVGTESISSDHPSLVATKFMIDNDQRYGRDNLSSMGCKDRIGDTGNKDDLYDTDVTLLPSGPISYLNELLENLLNKWPAESCYSGRPSLSGSRRTGDDIQFGDIKTTGGISSVNTDLDKEKAGALIAISSRLSFS